MYLKEAFEYANCINKLISELSIIFYRNEGMYKVTETHLKSRVDKGFEDEIIDVTGDTYDPEKLFKIQDVLVDDVAKLYESISMAKRSLDIDIDGLVASNKATRRMIADIRAILSVRKKTEKEESYGYRINADGNQVMYRYEVVKDFEPNFNREMLSDKLLRKIKEADEISMEIERAMVNTPVDFEPHFDYRGLMFNDIYEMI